MWSWPIAQEAAQLTEMEIGRYVAVGTAVGVAFGALINRIVQAVIRYRASKRKINRDDALANQQVAQAEFDFQQRIDASIEVARKKLIRDQDSQIKKLENKVDKLEEENDRCRQDYQKVLADNIAQKRINLEVSRHVDQLEIRMKKYEELMVNAGINFIPLIIIRDRTKDNPETEGGADAGASRSDS